MTSTPGRWFGATSAISLRLGSVGIVRLMLGLGLTNTIWALLVVYTAAGLPLTIFVMTQFMRQVPAEHPVHMGASHDPAADEAHAESLRIAHSLGSLRGVGPRDGDDPRPHSQRLSVPRVYRDER